MAEAFLRICTRSDEATEEQSPTEHSKRPRNNSTIRLSISRSGNDSEVNLTPPTVNRLPEIIHKMILDFAGRQHRINKAIKTSDLDRQSLMQHRENKTIPPRLKVTIPDDFGSFSDLLPDPERAQTFRTAFLEDMDSLAIEHTINLREYEIQQLTTLQESYTWNTLEGRLTNLLPMDENPALCLAILEKAKKVYNNSVEKYTMKEVTRYMDQKQTQVHTDIMDLSEPSDEVLTQEQKDTTEPLRHAPASHQNPDIPPLTQATIMNIIEETCKRLLLKNEDAPGDHAPSLPLARGRSQERQSPLPQRSPSESSAHSNLSTQTTTGRGRGGRGQRGQNRGRGGRGRGRGRGRWFNTNQHDQQHFNNNNNGPPPFHTNDNNYNNNNTGPHRGGWRGRGNQNSGYYYNNNYYNNHQF
jgi:hypothetical protein